MSRIKLVLGAIKITAAAVFVLGSNSVSYAKDKDCWAEFFQNSQYSGEHFRLEGPIQLDNLHSVQGKNWEKRIGSLKVGPKAKVTVFENINFKLTLKEMGKYPELLNALGLTEQDAKEDAELIFDENSVIHDLSDFNFRNKIRSLKIDCD
ncbi:MAG: beta/gamma crystallin domain-containing protein [Methylomonas sp.]|nr:beta/gamma crystallin domain-containing protein [Methylomonas sp.]